VTPAWLTGRQSLVGSQEAHAAGAPSEPPLVRPGPPSTASTQSPTRASASNVQASEPPSRATASRPVPSAGTRVLASPGCPASPASGRLNYQQGPRPGRAPSTAPPGPPEADPDPGPRLGRAQGTDPQDAGVYPRPAEFIGLSTLWSSPHAEWTTVTAGCACCGTNHSRGGRAARPTAGRVVSGIGAEKPGGHSSVLRERRRLLHPQPHFIHTPMLRSSVPLLKETTPSLQALRTALAHIPGLEFLHGFGSGVVNPPIRSPPLSAGGGVPPPAGPASPCTSKASSYCHRPA
jgi:hypothetical protein